MGESVRGVRIKPPALRWCSTCGTRHTAEDECPGDLLATGPERHGWRARASTRHGIEVHGVLIAPVDDRWRARIVTYPNVVWVIPGGGSTSIKFVGLDPRHAEQQAIDFVEAHCKQKGHTLSHELPSVEAGFVDPEQDPAAEKSEFSRTSRRKLRSMSVRYGVGRIRHTSETSDVSEG
ncbi:MAG: hypothetical protein R3344_06265, partial [Acidobacteriota bacterium]|nr:hypothetical protein [Acidobacteriota bacterium]